MRGPKLTIGLPVYNSERYLSESLQSLLGQTYGDFVLLISDNASIDSTADICHDYAKRDRRIHYHRNSENIGLSPNFNLVAERCETPFFKWSTGDDYWAPSMLEKTLPVIEADANVVLCYPKTILVNSVEGTETPLEDSLNLMQDDPCERFIGVLNYAGFCNFLLGISRTAALRKTSMLGPYPSADLNLIAELAIYGKFFEVQEYLFYRRLHEEASSWARRDAAHQVRRFHSAKTKNIQLYRWRRHVNYIFAVTKGPIEFGKKLKMYWFLLKRMVRARRALARELWNKIAFRLTVP